MVIRKSVKEWKSVKDQVEILHSRGLIIEDTASALQFLRSVGYYRFTGYAYPFRDHTSVAIEKYHENTFFSDIKKLYFFDQQLRLLVLEGLEIIEIAVRTDISYQLGKQNPLAYKKEMYFERRFTQCQRSQRVSNYEKLQQRLRDRIVREEKTDSIKHHLVHYNDIPIWVVCEIWDFGILSNVFRGMKQRDKDTIAHFYRLKNGKQLEACLHSFNIIRNICAHYGRLWNRAISKKTDVRTLGEEWHNLSNNKPFVYFCLMKKMIDTIDPESQWGEIFLNLIETFPRFHANTNVGLEEMGITIDMKNWSLWSR
ncbi:MAG: Abi family protein [Alcaligenaceae bacterium]|nr:Abi family protein [Alcaligenaceae bacterium]